MYIKTGEHTYSCTNYLVSETSATFFLSADDLALGDSVGLYQDDGFLLAEHQVSDYLRTEFSNGALLLTTLEPSNNTEIGEVEEEVQPDIIQLRADVDFLAALQGVTL